MIIEQVLEVRFRVQQFTRENLAPVSESMNPSSVMNIVAY